MSFLSQYAWDMTKKWAHTKSYNQKYTYLLWGCVDHYELPGEESALGCLESSVHLVKHSARAAVLLLVMDTTEGEKNYVYVCVFTLLYFCFSANL